MSTITEDIAVSDVVKYEADGRYSRENRVVAASQTLVVGSLVELSGGEVIKQSITEANCIGVMLTKVTTGAGETAACVVLERHAVVNKSSLNYEDADSESDADTQLIALGILPRTGV